MPAGLNIDSPAGLDALFGAVADRSAIALAVSGGADSLALMLLAHSWAAARNNVPRIVVYSVDHGLRPEAADEVAMVGASASALGLPFRALAWSGAKPATGLQEAARAARYALMGQAMAHDGATVLLTGHHLQDQAETVLMRLAHGSGLDGLKGMTAMAEVGGVPVHRPLLGVDPARLRAIVDAAGLVPVRDPSNADPHYERVRWRQAMPQLALLGLDAGTVAQFAQRAAEADAAIAEMADRRFSEIVRLDGFGAAQLDRDAYIGLSPAIATRLLSRLLNIVGGRQKPRALGQVERLRQTIADNNLGKGQTLLGCVVRLREDGLVVAREPGRALPSDAVLLPQSALVWDERFRIVNASADGGFIASVADYLPRHRLEDVLGFKVTAPAEAIRTAPIVRDAAGSVLSLGGWSFDDRIHVQLLID